jgi:hypothetical protein
MLSFHNNTNQETDDVFMDYFMLRYSLWITSAIGTSAFLMLIISWNSMAMVQRL